MNLFKKISAVIVLSVMIFVLLAPGLSAASGVTITDLKIIKLPIKTVLYEDDDWIYGTWDVEEDNPSVPLLMPSDKISFTHNPCGGKYPTRGMLDMTGLVIEVSYSDGSKKQMTYTETINKNGYYKANILVSPKGGKSYFVGTNTMEVYLEENVHCYDSFDVEFVSKENKPYFGVKEGSTAIISSGGYITGLKTSLSANQLFTEFLEYKNVEVSVKKIQSSFKFIGTGSVVTVKYPDGRQEQYTIIIYGDVDGNSMITSADTSMISDYTAGGEVLSEVQSKAANIDGMRFLNASDVSAISEVVNGANLNQADPSKS